MNKIITLAKKAGFHTKRLILIISSVLILTIGTVFVLFMPVSAEPGTLSVDEGGFTAIANGGQQRLVQQAANPYFNVDAAWDNVWGHEWEPDSSVTVEVHGIPIIATTDSWGNFNTNHSKDIIPGDTVTVSQGAVSKSHVVTALAVTVMDADTDTVSGTASPGSEMDIWVHDVDNVSRHETVAVDGTWSADFGIPGEEPGEEGTTDLNWGSNGNSAQCDADNDCTFAHWSGPYFNVNSNWGSVWGHEWEPNSSVSVEVNGISVVAATDKWGNFDTNLGEYIVAGNTVMVIQGAISKSHVITLLTVTVMDPDADTVSGTAAPESELDIWVHDVDNVSRHETVALDGTWSANFGIPGDEGGEEGTTDLNWGSNGNSSQCDTDNDCTYAEWSGPRFDVSALSDEVWGEGWERNSSLTVEVHGISEVVLTDAWGNFGTNLGENIVPGDTVTVTQATMSKSHVVTSLAIIAIDPDADTVSGAAAPESELDIWVHDVDNVWRHETVALDGTWLANFGIPGDEGNEEGTTDLNWGSNGNSSQCDTDNDCTTARWSGPYFNVGASWGGVWGHDWQPNSSVMVEMNGISVVAATDTWGDFNANINEEIIAGDTVVVTQGVVSKSHVVTSLAVTSVDADIDTVFGTAEPESELDIWVHDVDNVWRHETVALDGIWSANFGIPGDESGEEGTTDLIASSNGNSSQCDSDKDCTFAGFRIADPYITASVSHEEIWANDWPDEPEGQTLYYRVYGSYDPANPEAAVIAKDYFMTLIVTPWGTEAGDRFFEDLDLSAGQTLIVRNRQFTGSPEPGPLAAGIQKELAISEIEVTSVNPDTDIISGIAYFEQGPKVCADANEARLCSDDDGFTWNPDGSWAADFSGISEIKPGQWNSASQFDEDGDETHFWWNLPPWIVAELAQEDSNGDPIFPDNIRAESWTGPTVTLTIDDPSAPGAPVYQAGPVFVDAWGNYDFELGTNSPEWSGFDLEEDLIVTITDGTDTKELVVERLTINRIYLYDEVPPNVVEGTAYPGKNIRVEPWTSYGWWAERWVTADALGNWSADFDRPGSGWREQWIAAFGAAAGEGGGAFAEIYDEDNDRTWSVYHEPDPRIIVVRGNDRVEVIDFPEGNEVTIEIDDPAVPGSPDYFATGIVSRNPDRPWETLLVFQLGEYTVPDESQVTATDGETTVIHEVEITFTLEAIDPDGDTVSGTAPLGAAIAVEVYHGIWRYPIADDSGNWLADFSVPGEEPGAEQTADIGYGTRGRAVLVDLEGNATQIEWRMPDLPSFSVRISDQEVHGYQWPAGALVALAIDDPDTPESPDYEESATSGPAPWDPEQTFVWFAPSSAGFTIESGFEVVMESVNLVKTHIVTGLEVTLVDIVSDIVSGVAEPGSHLDVGLHDEDESWMTVTADPAGEWSADFSARFDIIPGSGGEAYQHDDDGDNTQYGFWVPHNQSPSIIDFFGPADPVEVGTEVFVVVDFVDENLDDTHTAIFDWGDGVVQPGLVDFADGQGYATGAHTYDTTGVFIVTVIVTDAGGLSDQAEHRYIIVYDPKSEFVTGGGWIASPEGAFSPEPELIGKAHFGFVAMYKKNGEPQGAIALDFPAAMIELFSDQVNWLVIDGAEARFSGVGTINETGEYGFWISMFDAKLTADRSDSDLIRVRIWEVSTGTPVYDNEYWADPTDVPTTELGGGQVVIHKPKGKKRPN